MQYKGEVVINNLIIMEKERETLMSLNPQTTYEKLIWERHFNKTLRDALEKSQLELGALRSEFDEFKYLTKTSKDIKSKYAILVSKQTETQALRREVERRLRDSRKSEEKLIMKIAQLNLKLGKYEKTKPINEVSPTIKEK